MNLAPCVCLFSLAAFSILPRGCGEELPAAPPAPAQLPAVPAALPHPIFEHWQEVLAAQCAPEAFYAFREGEPLSEEEQAELEEIKAHADAALPAATALYAAQLGIIEKALRMPGCDWLEEVDVEDEPDALRALLAPFEAELAEGFRRDLEALSHCSDWLDAGRVRPGLRPGRQELLFRPASEALAFEQVDGCNAEIGAAYEALNEAWKKRQRQTMATLLAAYAEAASVSALPSLRDPLTGQNWQEDDSGGKLTEDTVRYRADMQSLLRREEQAWQQYLEAMLSLVAPSMGYRGSGTGISMSDYERYLLDTRERFFCMLHAGISGIGKLPHLAVERGAELAELHRMHRFGEIFTADATLFRHPVLEGKPWCIRFPGQGAGFIFVCDGAALRAFAAKHPEGGELLVRGYQSIEQTGTPYEPTEEDEGDFREGLPPERPAGGLQLRQVFYLLSTTAPRQETDEVEEATRPRGCSMP